MRILREFELSAYIKLWWFDRTPAYPPKAPIQGARKMAPEGGLPEILLPYIAFCFDPRYARNEGP